MTARQKFTENENNDMAFHTIEICAGVGMLGEGLRAGLTHLGLAVRTVCYLEREAYPAAVLASRIQEQSLDAAPIWSDLLTFDARRWAGAVDGIAAGFPCQDLSLAGKRAGLDGKRSGLFFDILDIADACGAWFLFLENVAGIASATASVVDEAEGDLEERAASRVVGELAERGWNAEWLTLSASDVGASHGRERWFCFAWRTLDDSAMPRLDGTGQRAATDCEGGQCLSGAGCEAMGHANDKRAHRSGHGTEQDRSAEPANTGGQLGHTPSQRCGETRQCDAPTEHARSGGAGAELADAERDGQRASRRPRLHCQGESRALVDELQQPVADTRSTRLPQRVGECGVHSGAAATAARPVTELCGRPLFAPGPADPRWRDILRDHPEHAPALEPAFCGVVDGMAFAMDQSRAQRLKCGGNGVVALTAAVAFVVLARRAGLTT